MTDLGKSWKEVDAGLGGISDLVREEYGGEFPGWYDIWRFQDDGVLGSWTLLAGQA